MYHNNKKKQKQKKTTTKYLECTKCYVESTERETNLYFIYFGKKIQKYFHDLYLLIVIDYVGRKIYFQNP